MSNSVDLEDYHYRFKVVVLGSPKVGKTTFLDTLTENNGKVISLDASDEISERITIQAYQHFIFKMTYWELPCRERHMSFISNYCLGAAVAIIMVDTTKNNTLEKAEQVLKAIEDCDIPLKIMVCNKMDLLGVKSNISNPVVQQDAQTIAKNYNCQFFNCNANSPEYIDPIFKWLMDNVIQYIGPNLELRNLTGKNICVGKKLFTHPDYLKSLKDSQYFKD